jgi:hypothetical protein
MALPAGQGAFAAVANAIIHWNGSGKWGSECRIFEGSILPAIVSQRIQSWPINSLLVGHKLSLTNYGEFFLYMHFLHALSALMARALRVPDLKRLSSRKWNAISARYDCVFRSQSSTRAD